MDISVKTDTYLNEDRSWLGGSHGTTDTETVTLDVSSFTAGTHYPNGFIPSGTPLGKITASGLYGPYGASPSEVQQIAVDATGGTFTITFDGQTTAAISATATAAAVQTALEAISNINPGDVVVTGGPGAAGGATPYILTFGGRYLGQNVPQVTTAAGSLTGGASTATPSTTTAGGGAVSDGREVLVGFLYSSTEVRTDVDKDVGAPMFTHGKVRSSKLPFAVDAAGQADVAGRIRFI